MTAGTASEGGCRCGQVRFSLQGVPLITMACHCRGCQKMTASAYSVSAFYTVAQFELKSGEPVIGGLHGATRHHFCPHCMSWLYTLPEGMDDFINVRSTMMDEPMHDAPFIETVTTEALPWARTGAVHAFEGFPPRDKFPALIADFVGRKDEVANP